MENPFLIHRPRIYVDQLPDKGWGKWSGGGHMLANDLDALHAMAKKIGLRRAWFQKSSRFAHYDVTRTKRALAVSAGAIEIRLGELPADILMRVEHGVYEKRYVVMARLEEKQ